MKPADTDQRGWPTKEVTKRVIKDNQIILTIYKPIKGKLWEVSVVLPKKAIEDGGGAMFLDALINIKEAFTQREKKLNEEA
jgi:hypothetical protein